MLKKKAISKIFVTTLTVCLLLLIYLIPTNDTNKVNKNIIIEYSSNMTKENIYLLANNNLLIKDSVLISKENDLSIKITKIISSLINSSNEIIPNGLNRVIPKNTKVLAVNTEEGIATIDFSNSLLVNDKTMQEKIIEAISYTILDLDEIQGVTILVEGNLIEGIPEIITKEYGINKIYDITSFKNVQKVIEYYIINLDDNNYYVPITKYVDDNRDKIKIIIEDLSSRYAYDTNLISFLNNKTELLNYELANDTMILNFNNSIFINDRILEEVVYSISYSVFDNYEVNNVVFQVESKEITKKTLKDIEK